MNSGTQDQEAVRHSGTSLILAETGGPFVSSGQPELHRDPASKEKVPDLEIEEYSVPREGVLS